MTIGTITTYDGDEHPALRGHEVKVVAILTDAAAPNRDPDAGYAVLTTDAAVAERGGLGPHDRAEVVPWLAQAGRFSFVGYDPRVTDLPALRPLVAPR